MATPYHTSDAVAYRDYTFWQKTVPADGAWHQAPVRRGSSQRAWVRVYPRGKGISVVSGFYDTHGGGYTYLVHFYKRTGNTKRVRSWVVGDYLTLTAAKTAASNFARKKR